MIQREQLPGREQGSSSRVSFMIVGTQRSGTTLVQRLACEIPGVRVPAETQFFNELAPRLLRRRGAPLDATSLVRELEAYSKRKNARELGIDPSLIVAGVNGATGSVFEIFSAIVRSLAGAATVYGEKSPLHLLWGLALGRRFPHLKFVAVVRDPRAVVASSLRLHWNTKSHVVMAQWWSLDQRYLVKIHRKLGSERVLVLHYEDVVAHPSAARRRIAHFLGLSFDGRAGAVALKEIALPRETWKANATDPVNPDRARAWQASLLPSQTLDITALCRRQMKALGYREGLPSLLSARRRIMKIGLGQQARRLRFTARRGITLLKIRALAERIPKEVA